MRVFCMAAHQPHNQTVFLFASISARNILEREALQMQWLVMGDANKDSVSYFTYV